MGIVVFFIQNYDFFLVVPMYVVRTSDDVKQNSVFSRKQVMELEKKLSSK